MLHAWQSSKPRGDPFPNSAILFKVGYLPSEVHLLNLSHGIALNEMSDGLSHCFTPLIASAAMFLAQAANRSYPMDSTSVFAILLQASNIFGAAAIKLASCSARSDFGRRAIPTCSLFVISQPEKGIFTFKYFHGPGVC
jgi:hypothetical protein